MGIADIIESYLNAVCIKSSVHATIKDRYSGKRHITTKTRRKILTIIENTINVLSNNRPLDAIFKGRMLNEITNQCQLPSDISLFKHYYIALNIPAKHAPYNVCNIIDYLITRMLSVFDIINADQRPLTLLRLRTYRPEIDHWFTAVGV